MDGCQQRRNASRPQLKNENAPPARKRRRARPHIPRRGRLNGYLQLRQGYSRDCYLFTCFKTDCSSFFRVYQHTSTTQRPPSPFLMSEITVKTMWSGLSALHIKAFTRCSKQSRTSHALYYATFHTKTVGMDILRYHTQAYAKLTN